MSTSMEELADRLEAFLRVLESARRCENKTISVWSGDVEVVTEALEVARLAATPKAGVDREVIAREICLSYGRDPDEPTSPLEMCTADNQPVPTWEVYNEQAEWLLERYTILALPSVLGGVAIREAVSNTNVNCLLHWLDKADAALQLPEAEIQRSLADELEAAANWMQLYLDTYGELGDDATQASIDDWHDAVKHARKSGGFCS